MTMIQEFVDRFMENKPRLEELFSTAHPQEYKDIVAAVVAAIGDSEYGGPDATRIHEIDDGSYQGTLVYVIGGTGYQPDNYWYCRVGYGSCSGCDTLQSISGYSEDKPTERQVADYMTLALHVVQGIRKMGGDTV